MSLRYALLAVLTAQPMTGYDLARTFHASVGHVWNAPNSQIYPELHRMENDGLIAGEDVTWGSRGTKRRYSITDAGIEAFRAWMTQPLDYAPERDPAHLKAAYFEWTDADSAREQLRRHAELYRERRGQWMGQLALVRDREHPLVRQRLEIFDAADHDRIVAFKVFAYEGLVAQADQEIAWAERGLALIDSLADHQRSV